VTDLCAGYGRGEAGMKRKACADTMRSTCLQMESTDPFG